MKLFKDNLHMIEKYNNYIINFDNIENIQYPVFLF
jgi:hypothetical protein